MAKLVGPALSLDASKSMKKTLTFQRTPSGNKIYKWMKPGGRAPFIISSAQSAQRALYQTAVNAWNALSSAEKAVYEATAKAIGYIGTGYNYFLHQNLVIAPPPPPPPPPPDYETQYPIHDSDHVKATSMYDDPSTYYAPWIATDPTKSLTGGPTGNQWASATNDPQRFHIDLGSAKVIKRIYYEGSHNEVGGAWNLWGVKNFTFWGSNSASAFADVVYDHDTNWVQLPTDPTLFQKHNDLDESDPQYAVVTNSTPYRYYAMKCIDTYGAYIITFRRIELQIDKNA